MRVIRPESDCSRYETRLEFQSFDAANSQAADFQAQIDDLEARVAALEDRMDTAESDIDNLETRMDTAETDIDNLEGRMDTAEDNITALDTRVTTIRNFFTGVANNIIGCFTSQGSTFSITFPPIVFPEISIEILGEDITIVPEFTLFPGFTIGVPVFNASTVINCLNNITTATTE